MNNHALEIIFGLPASVAEVASAAAVAFAATVAAVASVAFAVAWWAPWPWDLTVDCWADFRGETEQRYLHCWSFRAWCCPGRGSWRKLAGRQEDSARRWSFRSVSSRGLLFWQVLGVGHLYLLWRQIQASGLQVRSVSVGKTPPSGGPSQWIGGLFVQLQLEDRLCRLLIRLLLLLTRWGSATNLKIELLIMAITLIKYIKCSRYITDYMLFYLKCFFKFIYQITTAICWCSHGWNGWRGFLHWCI